MDTTNMQKLEVIKVFKAKYGEWIHPQLKSVKFCQYGKEFYMELLHSNSPEPVTRDINLVSVNFDEIDNLKNTEHLFEPSADFVDNTHILLSFEPYSLATLVEGLFTDEIAEELKKNPPVDLDEPL